MEGRGSGDRAEEPSGLTDSSRQGSIWVHCRQSELILDEVEIRLQVRMVGEEPGGLLSSVPGPQVVQL